MSLTAYKKKRNFAGSPEPASGDKTPRTSAKSRGNQKKLRFVIQRHHATSLHYDFRLEMKGVLKSWAVPKGPSMNPADKRLAMMVEDHPYDYKDFEGIIPAGHYGAGVVYKWDEGYYEPLEKTADPEKELLKELKAGSLKFTLKGKKLKGEFALVKMKGKQDNAWLLIKHKDRFSTGEPYDSEDAVPARVKAKKNNRKGGDTPRASAKQTSSKRPPSRKNSAKRNSGEGFVKPMLATLTSGPFSRKDWLFENKWDGYRVIARLAGDKVWLYSRSGKSFNSDYAPVAEALNGTGHDLVLDGEIVVLNGKGKPEFQLLQNYRKSGKGNLVYYVFDLLELDGYDLKEMPLLQRKELLDEVFKTLIPADGPVRKTEYILKEGEKYFRKIKREKGEGIVAKSAGSRYLPGRRSDQWLKIKTQLQQEAVIGGFTEPRGSRKQFGALILGVYQEGQLEYIGHTGGGFSQASLQAVHRKMLPLVSAECPFRTRPKTNAPVTWIKPELVCEVKFAEWTESGNMRQPIFIALRDDKAPESIVHEEAIEKPGNEAAKAKADTGGKSGSRKSGGGNSGGGKSGGGKSGRRKSLTLKAGNRTITVTNPDKVYWPGEKITKSDLVRYYQHMAPYVLPYLKERPQSLHRHPDGITRPGFYQKDFDLKNAPEWIRTVPVFSESNKKEIDYLLCNNAATLLYMVNLGCIELNPWLSRQPRLDFPDYIAIDLDPEKISFKAVVETALAVREVLDELKLACFCKTSGATGLHIYVPLNGRYDFEVTRATAQFIAQRAHERVPSITSLERSPSKRQKKVYLDYLQNTRGQTLAAPYSARPRPHATVSTPLDWDEVNDTLDPVHFTIHNIPERVNEKGDLWETFRKTKNSLKSLL